MKWKRRKAQNSDRQFHRKKNKYLVRSVDTSLDENNYDRIDITSVEEKEIDVPLEKKEKQVTKEITWTTKKPMQNIRQGPQNIVPNRPGVKPEYRDKVEPLVAWSTFIDDDIIQLIVTYTNQSINESLCRLKQNKKDKKVCHLIETNRQEIRAFVGLWYIRELLNWTFHDITTAYSREYGYKIFNATMSIKRSRFLCANIRFDDITSRTERFQHDRAATVRNGFLNTNRCKKNQ